MNKQIQLLAEQAGIAVWGDAVYMYDPKDTLDSTVMAKFAELIVRECADVLLKWKDEPFPFDEDLAASLIKEHFGVEE